VNSISERKYKMPKSNNPVVKVVLVGNPLTGKTSLLKAYTSGTKFTQGPEPTSGVESTDCKHEADGKPITFELNDTSGEAGAANLVQACFESAHIFFCCVSREELDENFNLSGLLERFGQIKEKAPGAKVQFIVTKVDTGELSELEKTKLKQLQDSAVETLGKERVKTEAIITSAHNFKPNWASEITESIIKARKDFKTAEEERRVEQPKHNIRLLATMAFSVAATGSSAYFLMKAIEVASSTSLAAVTAMSSIALPGISALMLLYAAYKAKQSDASLSENLLLALSLLNLLPAGIAVFNCVASSAITSAVSGAALTGFAMASIATGGALAAVCFLAVCGMLYKHLNANKSAGFESGGTSVPTPANPSNSR
jgi:small GTP-binding protein